jgi:hypothetical protein
VPHRTGLRPQSDDGNADGDVCEVSVATGLRVAQPGLDFRQFSFDHTVRVLRDWGFADFDLFPLLQYALVPRAFRPWVSGMTHARLPESLLPGEGMQRCVIQRNMTS